MAANFARLPELPRAISGGPLFERAASAIALVSTPEAIEIADYGSSNDGRNSHRAMRSGARSSP